MVEKNYKYSIQNEGIALTIKNRLLKFAALKQNVRVGKKFHVGPFTRMWAPNGLTVGNDVYVGKGVTIEVDGCIGDGVLIANNVGIVGRTDHDITSVGTTIRRSPWVGEFKEQSKFTTIGSDVWVGFGSIILSGVTIGDSSIIAAGSIVTKNIPSNVIVGGSPAVVLRNRFDEKTFKTHWKLLELNKIQRICQTKE